MNIIRVAYTLMAFSLFLTACKSRERETPSGMKYEIVKQGDGVQPKVGEIVVFEFVTKDSKDSVWNSTYKRGLPGMVQIQDSAQIATEDGMLQMFRMLSKGDSVKVTMPVTKFFSDFVRSPIPPTIDSTLKISYFFKVEDILAEENFQEYQTDLLKKRAVSQKAADEKLIASFLKEKDISAERDTTGIHYVIHTSMGKEKPTPQNCVNVDYEGKLLETGEPFDKNTISFPLNQVIKGWQVGIPLLGIGDSATLYIPSAMAYGPQGVPGAIPPNSILVFDVKLIGIGNEYDPATGTCK